MKYLLILLLIPSFINAQVIKEDSIHEELFESELLVETILEQVPAWDSIFQENVKNFAPLIIEVADSFGVDKELMLSIAWTESHFNPNAKSWAGASGILQVMPKTAAALLKKHANSQEFIRTSSRLVFQGHDHNIVTNLILGTIYVKNLQKRFKNDKLAIVSYNMGPTWVSRQLRNNQQVGVKNNYLNKVSKALATFAMN